MSILLVSTGAAEFVYAPILEDNSDSAVINTHTLNLNGQQTGSVWFQAQLDMLVAGELSGFSDSERAGSGAVDALGWCVEAGILTGVYDDTLDPQGTTTRSQIVAILMRFAER